jgi:hypothetical protein
VRGSVSCLLLVIPKRLKLTVTPFRVRLEVMRKDAVYAVLLNVTLFRGMSCAIAQDPRYLRFSVLAPSGTIHYNLRVSSFSLLTAQSFKLNWACNEFLSSLTSLGGERTSSGRSTESDQRQHPSCIGQPTTYYYPISSRFALLL